MVTLAAGPGGDLEAQIEQWRQFVARRHAMAKDDVDELEDHLRGHVADLGRVGLTEDEAFLVAVKRMGSLDEVSQEFAREHSDRLWRQLVLPSAGDARSNRRARRELLLVLLLAVASGLAINLPELFGISLNEDGAFYARNLSLFSLPFLAGYFAWKRGMAPTRALGMLVPPFLLGAALVNAPMFVPGGSTQVLAAIHLPIVLWFVVGLAYVGGDWRSHQPRMDFIRFTGEWAIYYTLLALGGGVLVGLTAAGFAAVSVEIEPVLTEWVLPCGAMGAVMVAAWLVEAKQSVVENMAPVLTRVFTPLTTLMLLALLTATLAAGDVVEADRTLLILVDLILVLVFGLLLYSVSARDADAAPSAFDRWLLLLLASAVVVDLLMLGAMLGRIAEFGASPNKVAALGLNLVLLVSLTWSARLLVEFLRGRRPAAALERWQTTYLPVLAAWAAVVVAVLPPLFSFQ
jgi:hypothetical protein